MVICLELDADLHTAQLMPLPLTVSCFCKIQIGFTFLVPAHLGSPGQKAVERVCVPSVNYSDGLGRCILYCILFVFMLALLCFCVAAEFSVNKDLYKIWRPVCL